MYMMIHSNMNYICEEPLWNLNKTWFTDDPDFTSCFEKSVLAWIPGIILVLLLPLEIYHLSTSKARNIPFNYYNINKLVLIGLLGGVACLDSINGLFQMHELKSEWIDIISPAIKFIFCVLFFILTLLNIKYGIRSSGPLFIFSFLLVLTGIPQLRTILRQHAEYDLYKDEYNINDSIQFYGYMAYYFLGLVIFFLNCFADKKPSISDQKFNENVCPEFQSSFLSRIFFTWFDPMGWKGYRTILKNKDLWNLDRRFTSTFVVEQFEKSWNREINRVKNLHQVVRMKNAIYDKNSDEQNDIKVSFEHAPSSHREKETASIIQPIIHVFGWRLLGYAALKLISDTIIFANPFILKLLIGFVISQSGDKEPLWRGYLYVFLLAFVACMQSILIEFFQHGCVQEGIQTRSALVMIIYKKILTISNNARNKFTVGEIINLMSIDAGRFIPYFVHINIAWSAPFQITLAVYLLWQILGFSAIAGLIIMIILIPINGIIVARVKKLQMRQMKYKDERVKLMNEILSGMKVLKLYSWEVDFEKQIYQMREKEMRILKTQAYLNAVTSFIWATAPFLVTVVTFIVYVLSDEKNVLDAETAFVSLSLFSILNTPMSTLPTLITNVIQVNVAIRRINTFLNSENLDTNAVTHDQRREALYIENGNFSWNSYEDAPFLKDINLSINRGDLVAIVGSVGSGKTSLVSALLGEMYKQSGIVNTDGSIAYVPQQAWIRNATIKDNITLSHNADLMFYKKVIDACALRTDLKNMPAGDYTEVGEKGTNLSGGQKQRISLARAAYSQSEIYLLDDPLSAVDAHVGKHLFENVIGPNGILKNKTRILVTHGSAFLPEVDYIFVLKDGVITNSGTYENLMRSENNILEFLMMAEVNENERKNKTNEHKLTNNEEFHVYSEQNDFRSSSTSLGTKSKKSFSQSISSMNNIPDAVGTKLIVDEKEETGSVKMAVYTFYLVAVGPLFIAATFVMNLLFQGFSLGSNVWLAEWSSDTSAVTQNGTQVIAKRNMYLQTYSCLGIAQAIFSYIGSIALFLGSLRASELLHNNLLKKITRWAVATFDATPVGRILSRFSFDIDVLDDALPQAIIQAMRTILSVITTLGIISYSTPTFIGAILPIFAIYYMIQKFYVATSRQMKRIDSVTKSPIYMHYGESINGTTTIRAYNLDHQFIKDLEEKVDNNVRSNYLLFVANRWLAIRLENIGALVIFLAAIFAVLGRDVMNAGLVGLSINYAMQITQLLNQLVRVTTTVEMNVVSVERIKEYSETTEEASHEMPYDKKVPKEWPTKGEIEFRNFSVRYREGLEMVLKGISFKVDGGEKVGIVGRTGAGKSSLTLSLFRIIEATKGSILIDGIDIAKLGLHTLRSRLTIIPQDPVLFSGTLRFNLDPTGEHNDISIWNALQSANLKNHVSKFEAGLEHIVSERGDNFSIGQKQLICLVRALLRKTKIIILDEATAAVDPETDNLIQNTIRTEFENCTVLTIAHRLNTIIDYDRIIVLDNGKIVEFDSPQHLLNLENSIFHKMAADASLI